MSFALFMIAVVIAACAQMPIPAATPEPMSLIESTTISNPPLVLRSSPTKKPSASNAQADAAQKLDETMTALQALRDQLDRVKPSPSPDLPP